MPHISIVIDPQPYEKKKEIAEVFTNELHRITGIPKEPISVVFHELSTESLSTGGVMLKEQFEQRGK